MIVIIHNLSFMQYKGTFLGNIIVTFQDKTNENMNKYKY